jgi:hypothetical protein
MSKPMMLTGGIVLLALGVVAWTVGHESQADLLAEASVSMDAALQTALAAVPGGRVVEQEIEREDGRLQYAFDILELDGGAMRDVEVDALSGVLLQNLSDDDDDGDDIDDGDDLDDGR